MADNERRSPKDVGEGILRRLRQCGDEFFYSYKVALVVLVGLCFLADASAFSMFLGLLVFFGGWVLRILCLGWNAQSQKLLASSSSVVSSSAVQAEEDGAVSAEGEGQSSQVGEGEREEDEVSVVVDKTLPGAYPAWRQPDSIYRWLRGAEELSQWLVVMGVFVISGSVLALVFGVVMGYVWHMQMFYRRELTAKSQFHQDAGYQDFLQSVPAWCPSAMPSRAMLMGLQASSIYDRIMTKDVWFHILAFTVYIFVLSIL